MPNKSGSLGQRPLWIIASLQAGRLDVLTIDPDGDGGYLPIFSFKEEAETFLRLSGDDGKTGWWSREATSGELVSVLLAPCAEVKQVALDPLPLSLGGAIPLGQRKARALRAGTNGGTQGGGRRACASLGSFCCPFHSPSCRSCCSWKFAQGIGIPSSGVSGSAPPSSMLT
jgi:hypothetical protein